MVGVISLPVVAAETAAEEISSIHLIAESSGLQNVKSIFDGVENNGASGKGGEQTFLTLEHRNGIGSLYLVFDSEDVVCTITDHTTGQTYTPETPFFYHQYLDIIELFGAASTSLTLDFEQKAVTLNEIHAFTPGDVPQFVQKWNAPAEGKADLLLLSAHGDDDQIFFAGVLPYYAVYKGCQTQVVYLTDHHNNAPYRVHETLDGLWASGVTNYPVFGTYPDYSFPSVKKSYVHYNNLPYAYRFFEKNGYPRDHLFGFVVEQLRRFKPQVALTHDFNGEYGHSHHMLCGELMAEAVTVSMDPSVFPDSAQCYGTWDVPKTYIHLYGENAIVLDLDTPLDCLDGLSAFQVSKERAFPCHVSQYKAVSRFINSYATAAQMQYSPSQYGLYRSAVGMDVLKNDFFENTMTYAQLEQARVLEETRLAGESALSEETRLTEETRFSEESRFAEEAKSAEETNTIARQRNRILIAAAMAVPGAPLLIHLVRRKKPARTRG